MATYKYGNVTLLGINAVRITVVKLEGDDIIGQADFKLRLHPCCEGQDPIALAIEKHRDTLTSW